jgi:hypothetical protein
MIAFVVMPFAGESTKVAARLDTFDGTLADLNKEAAELASRIQQNFEELGI